MTSLARGPARAQPPAGTRVPDGTGHPALHGLPAVWLRANCPCASCQDPASGQRLITITGLPAEVTVTGVAVSDATVEVVFGPDSHRAVFRAGWLASYGAPGGPGEPGDDRTEDAKRLWAGADLGGGLPQGWWPRYLADPAHRSSCLSAVLTRGAAVLHDVPCEPGAVLAVARSFGYVRETNYGRCSRCASRRTRRTSPSARCRSPRTPTTRTATRCPTVQLLHCLTNAARAATQASSTASTPPRRCAAAARGVRLPHRARPVTFRYTDDAAELSAHEPDDRPRPARADQADPLQQPVDAARCACPPGAAGRFLRRLPRVRRTAVPPEAQVRLPAEPATASSSTTPGSCTPAPGSPTTARPGRPHHQDRAAAPAGLLRRPGRGLACGRGGHGRRHGCAQPEKEALMNQALPAVAVLAGLFANRASTSTSANQ